MAEVETTVILAVFNDISDADHAVDMVWEWSESEKGREPDAIGVLVNQDWRLDAQLIGDESGFGEETGAMLDVMEKLLDESPQETAEFDEGFAAAADALMKNLGLDVTFIKRLRQELSAGHAILLLAPRPEDVSGSREQLESLGGRTNVLTLVRSNLFRAAAALDGDSQDEEFDFGYDEAGDYDYPDEDEEYFDYDDSDDDDYEEYERGNGRYR
jgi:hypothetical protein